MLSFTAVVSPVCPGCALTLTLFLWKMIVGASKKLKFYIFGFVVKRNVLFDL